MIANLAYSLIFGKPLIMYFGILTLFFLLLTAALGFLSYKGLYNVPFKLHPTIGIITITLAIIHAIFGLSSFFSF